MYLPIEVKQKTQVNKTILIFSKLRNFIHIKNIKNIVTI